MSSAIDPTKPTEGTATTESVRENFQAAKNEIEALQADVGAILPLIFPIGSLYATTLTDNAADILGFGTWVLFGEGCVPVCIKASDGDFDTIAETGGEKTHTLDTSEIPSHNHTQDSHNHTQNSHNHTQDSHNHTQDAHTHTSTHDGKFLVNETGTRAVPGSGANLAISASVSLNNTTPTNQAATATNQAATATNQATTATNQATGGGGAHNNLQPYIVWALWKRTE